VVVETLVGVDVGDFRAATWLLFEDGPKATHAIPAIATSRSTQPAAMPPVRSACSLGFRQRACRPCDAPVGAECCGAGGIGRDIGTIMGDPFGKP
jgi:hypothetical protein